jgi:prepilin-type N-terminal cleavage/methylation domain-containing protein
MKLNYSQNTMRKPGMTLLELTVVILVLLSLISILFVGARAWKKGSDRAANIMNIRNCQQAMRGHQNMRQLNPAAAFVQVDLEGYMKFPQNIGTVVTYTAGTVITAESANPAVSYAHIWLVPSAGGLPTADYGHTAFSDSTGW